MKRTAVIDIVGLSSSLIGEHTPFLQEFARKGTLRRIEPTIPAVTCTSQTTYLTGKQPSEHGIVANGWMFRDELEVKFWRQSARLIQSPRLWDTARQKMPDLRVANLFWWYNMYSSADIAVTPRPLYLADGRKLPDIYTWPMDLRFRLQKELGQFPLFHFWGPNTSIRASQWIADSARLIEQWESPDLSLVYLPHLDYNLQKYGQKASVIKQDLQQIDSLVRDLVHFYESHSVQTVLLSEYGITDVDRPIHLNRELRKAGLLSMKTDLGREYPDPGTSRAFAMADHQIAHIYIQDPQDTPLVRQILESTAGVGEILDREEQKRYGLSHHRSGELVAIADDRSWFTYYFWEDDNKAPDYARTVDIHRKPGFDPVEMFFDPAITFPKATAALKVLKKKLGFRMVMDLIALDAELVRGSHGRRPENGEDWPVLLTSPGLSEHDHNSDVIAATEVHDLILEILTDNTPDGSA